MQAIILVTTMVNIQEIVKEPEQQIIKERQQSIMVVIMLVTT